MRIPDPVPQFSHLAAQIKARFPDFGYLSVVEPRVVATDTRPDEEIAPEEQTDFLRAIWAPKTYISAGAYSRDLALKGAEQGVQLLRVHDVAETAQALKVWRGLKDRALVG